MNRKDPLVTACSVLGAISCIVLLAYLAGCGGEGSGIAADAAPKTGRMTLRVTDSPVASAERVVVEFTGVELKPLNGDAEVFEFSPRQIDLLALDGGGSETLLSDEELPAGQYEWIRLKVNAGRDASDSFIELEDGAIHPLFIPSGTQTGLKLIRGFTIGAGSTHNFTIDFDLRKSVVHPPGLGEPYLLKPVLRLVDNLQVGTLDGTVAAALIVADCEPAVYLFTGAGVVPDDLGSATAPLASTAVRLDTVTGDYVFRIGFVPAGPYTLAFTCGADDDGAEVDDVITFAAPIDATVTAGQTTEVEFLAVP
jgi:hypothetical protein